MFRLTAGFLAGATVGVAGVLIAAVLVRRNTREIRSLREENDYLQDRLVDIEDELEELRFARRHRMKVAKKKFARPVRKRARKVSKAVRPARLAV